MSLASSFKSHFVSPRKVFPFWCHWHPVLNHTLWVLGKCFPFDVTWHSAWSHFVSPRKECFPFGVTWHSAWVTLCESSERVFPIWCHMAFSLSHTLWVLGKSVSHLVSHGIQLESHFVSPRKECFPFESHGIRLEICPRKECFLLNVTWHSPWNCT